MAEAPATIWVDPRHDSEYAQAVSYDLLTEAGDTLITEAGDTLITEPLSVTVMPGTVWTRNDGS